MSRERLPGPLERPQQTFSGQAVDVLRGLLLDGRFGPGQRLNEVELASALGISRGPLREAIQRLRSEGLLTAVTGRGTYVRAFTPEELADLYEVRIALEAHAVRLAAENHADPAAVAELADQVHPDAFVFHQHLVALAGNPALHECVVGVHRQLIVALGRPLEPEQAMEEHTIVLDHVAGRRADEAVAALTDHLRRSLARALEGVDAAAAVTP